MIELKATEAATVRSLLRDAIKVERELEERLSHALKRKRSRYMMEILEKFEAAQPAIGIALAEPMVSPAVDKALHLDALERERVTAQPAEPESSRQIAKREASSHVV